jgi:hypothetical protein
LDWPNSRAEDPHVCGDPRRYRTPKIIVSKQTMKELTRVFPTATLPTKVDPATRAVKIPTNTFKQTINKEKI